MTVTVHKALNGRPLGASVDFWKNDPGEPVLKTEARATFHEGSSLEIDWSAPVPPSPVIAEVADLLWEVYAS